jgi:hypothetical protein
MPTRQKHPRLVVQHPAGVVCFLLLALGWFAGRLVQEPQWDDLRLLSRLSGYGAALCMLVPYAHVLRRLVLHRRLLASHRWLDAHIAASYLGFFLLLLHCRARAEAGLTLTLLVFVWLVMVSGGVGFYGQKLLYRLLPHLVPREYGLERLEPERALCLEAAHCVFAEQQIADWKKIPASEKADGGGLATALAKEAGSEEELTEAVSVAGKQNVARPDHVRNRVRCRALLGRALHRVLARPDLRLGGAAPAAASARDRRWQNRQRLRAGYPDLLRDVSQAVAEFCDDAIDKCLARPFTLWRWVRAGRESNRLYENHYRRALAVAADPKDRALVEEIWRLVETRRRLDFEYRLHALGRLWLLFHGPAALAMLVLLVEHVAMSMRFGGF